LNTGKKEATELLNTSKENLARELFGVRTKSSARCPIVPATDLKIDEIGIPVSIAYELLREKFIEHLQKELNFTYKEAMKATREEAFNPETQKLFKEFAEKQLVIINRPPTLHEYSMFCMKVRLNEPGDGDYVLRFPISICSPLNAKIF
jgi:DNA-directed RNA polymerase beta' subunit